MGEDSAALSKFTIAPQCSLEEAMEKIEENDYGTLVVVEGGRAIGTVTDGDIRKAILNHRLSVLPVRDVMNTAFISVAPGEIGKAKELFLGHFYLRLVPEVDGEGRLCGVLQRDKVV